MARWHHRLEEHGFGWIPGVGDGQGGLVCCGSWGRKESDTTEQLNWTEYLYYISKCPGMRYFLCIHSFIDSQVFNNCFLCSGYEEARDEGDMTLVPGAMGSLCGGSPKCE